MSYLEAIKSKTKKQQRPTQTIVRPRSGKAAPQHPLTQLQQTAGNHAVGRLVQAKLKVGQPGDRYEQEADRVAEQVMSAPDMESSVVSNSSTQLQRKCSDCESEEREETLHF